MGRAPGTASALPVLMLLALTAAAGCAQDLLVGHDGEDDLAAPTDLAQEARPDTLVTPDASSPVDGAVRCPAGYSACGTTCVDLLRDLVNCGRCGTVCDAQGANQICDSGVCKACGSGLSSCEGRCVNLQIDVLHCGSCRNFCLFKVCVGGSCVGCPAPLLGCGNACVDTTSNGLHCGRCNNACAPGLGCVNSACAPCPAPLVSCHGTCANLATDALRCGGCDTPCPLGRSCVQGACR